MDVCCRGFKLADGLNNYQRVNRCHKSPLLFLSVVRVNQLFERKAMKKIILFLISSVFFVFSSPVVLAADAPVPAVKEVFKSDKAVGVLWSLEAGGEAPSVARPGTRAAYVIQGGKLERHYPDGKTVPVPLKAGDTLYLDKPEDQAPYAIKNVGKTTVKIYLVTIK